MTYGYEDRSDTYQAIDVLVQASKKATGDGLSLREAQVQVQNARDTLTKAQKQLAEAEKPALPADPRATEGLRLLRRIASVDEKAGQYAIDLLQRLTAEQFAAIKPRLVSLKGKRPEGW